MDKKTLFVKTDLGVSEVSGQSDALYGDAKRVLQLVDDDSTVGEITKRAPPSLRDTLEEVLLELVDSGYIRDMRAPVNEPSKSALKISTPAFKMATPKVAAPAPTPVRSPAIGESTSTIQSMPSPSKGSDLDFSFITAGATPAEPEAVEINIQAEADRAREQAEASKAREQADAMARTKARQDQELLAAKQPAILDPAAKKAKLKTYDAVKERAKLEAAARARTEAAKSPGRVEVKDNKQVEADAARKLAEAFNARQQAETDRAREQAEATKAREQAEATLRANANQERIQAEQAVQAEAAAKAAKLKAYEAAKEKAKIEVATRARIEAEINQKKDAESSRLKLEQEALKARVESETRIKQEIELARLKAENEAERLRLELESARAKAEMEHRNRVEAEARAKVEAEARRKREDEAERLRLEKERAELEVARIKAEAELRMREEAELRVRAELEARIKAEELARHGERRNTQQNIPVGESTNKYGQVDPAQKLRESFVESFGQIKTKQKSGTQDFKLDTFSLIDTGKIAALTVPEVKSGIPPAGGSKVKAAIEQRAKREAEAQRIKAEQEAAQINADLEKTNQIKTEQDAAARIKAEKEEASARIKLERELYLLKAEQEEKDKAEAEEKKLAEQQSRQWEEAQRRAAMQESAEQERLAKQAAEAQLKAKKIAHKSPRKPLPIGKLFGVIFTLLVIAVFVLPYVWPMEDYITPLEKEISAQIKQPVRIKKINIALLPLPKLELHTVVVGGAQELKIDDVVLNFDISAPFAATKSINKMELSNVTFSGVAFSKVMAWIQAAGGLENYPVTRMELHHVALKNEEINLPALSGSINFDAQGKFSKADLKSDDAKLHLELLSQQNRVQLELNLRESNLPILSKVKFNDLSANAVLENGQITVSDFFAHIHGGSLAGKGVLNWSNGWKLQGQANAKSLELQRLFPSFGITGELYGDVNFSMNNANLAQLDKDPLVEGAFEAKNGVISKLDFDNVARFGARPGVAGHTNFSEMSGTLKADSRGQHIFLSKVVSVATTVSGLIDVDVQQQLSGKLLVDLKGQGTVPLQLSGSATDPMLQAGR